MGETLVFNLLGKILQTPPGKDTKDWFVSLGTEKIFDDVPFGGDHPDVVNGAGKIKKWLVDEFLPNPDEAFERLNIDYTRLLVGPGKPLAPPWESVYFNQQGLLFQEETIDVRNWYKRFNLEVEKLHNEPDDHIGLEFAFLGYLAALALTALEREEEAECDDILLMQRSFLLEHPAKWVPLWCEKMIEHAKTGFYQGVGLLVRGGLQKLAELHEVQVD